MVKKNDYFNTHIELSYFYHIAVSMSLNIFDHAGKTALEHYYTVKDISDLSVLCEYYSMLLELLELSKFHYDGVLRFIRMANSPGFDTIYRASLVEYVSLQQLTEWMLEHYNGMTTGYANGYPEDIEQSLCAAFYGKDNIFENTETRKRRK